MNDWTDEFRAKLKEAEASLQEAERIAKRNGMKVPIEQPLLSRDEKIRFPRGYIRAADTFRHKYNLRQIIDDVDLRSNIAYALQASDFLNYLINRFSVGLSVERALYKIAISHVISIIEALLYGVVNSYHRNCSDEHGVCKKSRKCQLYLKRANKYSFKEIADLLRARGIIHYSEKEKEDLLTLKGIRDRLHIWDCAGNEFLDHDFAMREYNISIRLLTKTRDELMANFRTYKAAFAFRCPRRANDP